MGEKRWPATGARLTVWLACIGAAAGLRAESFWIPAARSGVAEDARLVLQNLENKPQQISVHWLGPPGAEGVEPAVRWLEPGATLIVGNALQELFGLQQGEGALEVRGEGRLSVRAERVIQHPEGARGMTLPVLDEGARGAPGATLDLAYLPNRAPLKSEVWVALLAPGSEVDVLVYDKAGARLARRRVRDQGVRRFALTDLVLDAPELCRAQLRVRAGAAAAFAEMTLTASGDRFGYEARNLDAFGRDQILLPALRRATEQGLFTTTMVVFNPYGSASSVTINHPDRRRSRPLAPFEIVEIRDVLRTEFEVGEAATALRVTSGDALFVLGITEFRRDPDGGPAMAEAHYLLDTSDVPGPGQRLLLPPRVAAEEDAYVVAWAQAEVAGARVEANSASGQPTGEEAWVVIEPRSLAMQSLGELLPGATDRERPLGVYLANGALHAGMLEFRPGSHDPVWHGAELVPPDPVGECRQPAVLSFSASSYALPRPGPVTLRWETADAGAVTLQPEIGAVRADGLQIVELETTRTFTLRAANDCATVEVPLLVTVGVPTLSRVSAGAAGESRASGQPGELLSLEFDNLAEDAAVEELLVRVPGRATLPVRILARGGEGQVYAVVPYLTFGENADQQYAGEVEFIPVFANGQPGKGRPFVIQRAVYTGDPAAGFRALLDSVREAIDDNVRELALLGVTNAAAKAEPARKLERELRALVDRIAAAGEGMIALDDRPDSDPNALRAKVKAADLAALLAFNRNAGLAWRAILGARPQESDKEAAARLAGGARLAGTCLDDKMGGMIRLCKANQARERFQQALAEHATDFLTDLDQNAPKAADELRKWLIKKFVAKATVAAAKRMLALLQAVNIACIVDPLELTRFEVQTEGQFVRYVPPERRSLQPKEVLYAKHENNFTIVKVYAILVPNIPTDKLRDQIRKKELAGIKAGLKKLGYSDLEVTVISKIYEELLQKDPIQDFIVAAAQGHNEKERKPQVGRCDLTHVYPALNGPGREGNPDLGYKPGRSVLKLYTGRQSGDDDYFFLGKRPRRSEKLCIVPNPDKFLFHENTEALELVRTTSDPCAFHERITVSGPKGLHLAAGVGPLARPLSFSDRVYVGPPDVSVTVRNGSADAGTPTSNPNTQLIDRGYTLHDRDEPFVQEGSGGASTARTEARRTGPGSWRMSLFAQSYQEPEELPDRSRRFYFWPANTRLDIGFVFLRPPRENRYRMKVRARAEQLENRWCQLGIVGQAIDISFSASSPTSIGEPNPPLIVEADSAGYSRGGRLLLQAYAHGLGFSGPFAAMNTTCRADAEVEVAEEQDEAPDGDGGEGNPE